MLGVAQGVAEVVPVSSSAQLVLLPWLLDWPPPGDRTTFAAGLHAGSCAGIAWALRGELRALDRRTLLLVAGASVPAAVAGVLAADAVEERLGRPPQLAVLLAAAGLVMWAVDTRAEHREGREGRPGRQGGGPVAATVPPAGPGGVAGQVAGCIAAARQGGGPVAATVPPRRHPGIDGDLLADGDLLPHGDLLSDGDLPADGRRLADDDRGRADGDHLARADQAQPAPSRPPGHLTGLSAWRDSCRAACTLLSPFGRTSWPRASGTRWRRAGRTLSAPADRTSQPQVGRSTPPEVGGLSARGAPAGPRPAEGPATVGPREAAWAAAAQVVALVPGVSRSGATLTALRAAGVSRAEAERFSLLMSLPVTAGAAVLTLARTDRAVLGPRAAELAPGALTAAVAGSLAVRRRAARPGTPLRSAALYRLGLATAVVLRLRSRKDGP